MNANGKQATIDPLGDLTNRIIEHFPEPQPDDARYKLLALAALTIVLIGLCVMLALQFLPALAWGIAFAIIAAPLHRWVGHHITNPNIAALVTSVAVFLIVVLPGMILTYEIIREASSAAERLKTEAAGDSVRTRIAQIPALQGVTDWIDKAHVDLDAEIRRVILSYTREPSSLLQGSIAALIQFGIALFLLFHFLKDGSKLRDRVRSLLPMSCADSDQVCSSVSGAIHANVYATVVTSLIDAISGGLLFWAIGLPSPVLWGAVVFVLTLLPLFGSFLIWIPGTIYLLSTGQYLNAALLTSWGVLTAILVDSLLYVRLAGGRMRLHQVPSILAILGGLTVFGPTGIILGPAILAATVAVLEVWQNRQSRIELTQPSS